MDNLINFYNANRVEVITGVLTIVTIIGAAAYCFYILHEMVYEGAL